LSDARRRNLSRLGVIEDYFQDAEIAEKYRISPELGNVIFASGQDAWSFSLTQFAAIYLDNPSISSKNSVLLSFHVMRCVSILWFSVFLKVNPADFAKRLWGDKYFDKETRKVCLFHSIALSICLVWC